MDVRAWDAPRAAQPCDHYSGGRCCATKVCQTCGHRYGDHVEYPWTAGR